MIFFQADKIIMIYEVNAKSKSRKRNIMLQKYSVITEYVFKVGFSLYCLSVLFYFIYPIYVYYEFNEIIPIVPLYLPEVDEQHLKGYIIHLVFHLICMIVTLLASAGSDFVFALIVLNIPIMSSILGDNVDELNRISGDEEPDTLMMKAQLRNILIMHQEMMK